MRGIILAGGTGTRMRPATHITNKHMLPVYSSDGALPMIFYPINTLVNSGIEEILVVSSKEHAGHIIQNLSDGYNFKAKFTYKIQDINRVQMGIASALKLAKDFTKNDPFAVILGDNFYEDYFLDEFTFFSESCSSSARIFLKQVEDPERFGVYHDGSIEEKPVNPKSNRAVTGLYLYHPGVYDVVEKLKPSKRGELEITDVNQFYCSQNAMDTIEIKGFWSDMGTPQSIQRTQEFIDNKKYKVNFPFLSPNS